MAAKRLHILHLLQGLHIGGIEMMAASLARGLPPASYRTSFCTFDWQGELAGSLIREGYDIHFRKRRGRMDLGFVRWLAALVKRENVDIVQGHNSTALLYGALATSLVRNCRFLYTEHDRSFPTPRRERGLNALLSRRADAVVCVSALLKQQLVRHEKFPAKRVHVIHNGISLDAAARDRHTVRQDLDLGTRPTVGVVARLAVIKNHAMLLRAWKRVLRQVPNAVLLIVGNGSQEQALQDLATKLRIEDSVRFLGFQLSVNELFQAFDVFALSSFSEGLSLTLLEACSSGLPIVATRVGGNPEVVEDGKNGILVPSDDSKAMAEALACLLQDEAKRKVMAEEGRRLYETKFTLQAMLDAYTGVYQDLCPAGIPDSSDDQVLAGSDA